jgi:hypothetical protein
MALENQIVAIGSVRGQTPSRFGREHNLLFALPLQLRNQPFAASHSIDIGGVYESHSAIDGLTERSQRFGITHVTLCAADSPGAEADVGNPPTRASQFAIVHKK